MANRYWVGGTGNWDSTAGTKWATTSGGTGGAAVPTSSDNVYFDANSGTGTITIPAVTVNCADLDCTGFTGTLTATGSYPSAESHLIIYGSLYLSAGMTFNTPNYIKFAATSTGKTITTNGHSLVCAGKYDNTVEFNGSGGGWTFQDDATIDIYAVNGSIDTNGKTITADVFYMETTWTSTTLGASTIILGSGSLGGGINGPWLVNGSGTTINAGTSTIKFTFPINTGFGETFGGQGKTYYNVWFARGGSTEEITITGSNTFNQIKDTGTAAHTLGFTAGTTQTMASFDVVGSSGNLISVKSAAASTATHNLTLTGGGVVASDYLVVAHSVASPSTGTWYAGTHSTNNQSVATAGSGWIFSAAPLTISVSDSVSLTESTTSSVFYTTSTSVQISSGPDDGYDFDSTTLYNAAAYVAMVDGSTDTRTGYFRFQNVQVPKDAEIVSASLTFVAHTTYSANLGMVIYFNAADNPAAPTVAGIPSLPLTTARVFWPYSGWTAESTYTSSDISTVIQEIVNRAGWVSGNAMMALPIPWDDTYNKGSYAYAYDGDPTKAAILSVEYKQLSLSVSVSDSLSITEFVGYYPDEVSISESVSASISNNVSVSDSLSLSESVSIAYNYDISATDSISVVDSLTVVGNPAAAPYDTISLSESVSAITSSANTSVFDALTLTESVSITNPTLSTSVFDSVSITESLTGNVTGASDNLYETVSIAESVSALTSAANTSVSDSISLTESVSITNITLSTSVSDSVSIAENVTTASILSVSVYDQISEGESVTALTSSGVASVSDSVSITENVSAFLNTYEVGVDYVTVSEDIISATTTGGVSVSDSLTVSDVLTVSTPFQDRSVNTFDTLAITESLSGVASLAGVSITDTLTLSESVSVSLVVSASVSDSISISESISRQSVENISVYDSLSLSESTSALTGSGIASVFDAVSVSEHVALYIAQAGSLYETVTVSESVSAHIDLGNVSVFDSLSISELVTTSAPALSVNTSDVVSIGESVTNSGSETDNLYDVISVSESVTATTSMAGISITDSISVSESVTSESFLSASVSDLVSLSDLVTTTEGLGDISVSDYITLSDTVTSYATVSTSLSDSLSTSDSVSVSIGVTLSVSDSISLSESISGIAFTAVDVSDSIGISESVTTAVTGTISVYDALTLSESIESEAYLQVETTDSISISESLTLVSIRFSPEAPFKRPRGVGRGGGTSAQMQPRGTGSTVGVYGVGIGGSGIINPQPYGYST